MINIEFHQPFTVLDENYKFAVIMARQGEGWLFVRHRERQTWEIPGGHREAGETTSETALRELWEETGAVAEAIVPICGYSVDDGAQKTYGMLYYADTKTCGAVPEFEIEEVVCLESMPDNLTYPGIQPSLFDEGLKFSSAWRYTMDELMAAMR